jgi:putative heme transporter
MALPSGLKSTLVALKWLIFAIIIYFFVLPLIPGFGKAFSELSKVRPSLLVLGLGLELAALFAYSLLTHAALGDSRHSISIWRLFRIQLSTKSVSNVLPAGSAASSALGFKLLTSSGVPGPDAGFALATAGLGSAVVLNLILWVGLIASIPGQGVNAAYGSAALVGVILMLVATGLVVGLIDGQGRAERSIKWIATKLRMNPDNAADVLRQLGFRLQGLAREPGLKERVFVWALLNWLLDMAALWVFLLAFGANVDLRGLIVAFGLANIMAVVPITPGGLGIVEGIFIPTLVGFGLTRSIATVGVLSYRIAQYWMPLIVGAIVYLSLRVGPWAIDRHEKLKSFRRVAVDATEHPSNKYNWAEHYAPRDRTGQFPLPDFKGSYSGDADDTPI